MHDDAGPDFLQSIANIGSGARKRGESRQSSDFRSMQDCKSLTTRSCPSLARTTSPGGRSARPSRLTLIKRGLIGIFAWRSRSIPRAGATGICAWLSASSQPGCSGENAGCTENPLALAGARSRKINGLQPLGFGNHANATYHLARNHCGRDRYADPKTTSEGVTTLDAGEPQRSMA